MKNGMIVDEKGNKYWYKDNQLHREDGPACEYAYGDKFWYINDQLHRIDGPAIEKTDGTKCWYINDQRHREDGPAIEYADGTKEWFINDQLHREDGPAYEGGDGTQEWYINGRRHQNGDWVQMNVDVPSVFVAKVVDYHEFDQIKSILVSTVRLAYEFEEVGCDGLYHAVFWAGDRPAEYIKGLVDGLKASLRK
jgi:hypothetical protein